MSIKAYRPTTPAQRQKTTQDFDQITSKKPMKSLTLAKKQQAGKTTKAASPSVIVAVASSVTIACLRTTCRAVSSSPSRKSNTIQTVALALPASKIKTEIITTLSLIPK